MEEVQFDEEQEFARPRSNQGPKKGLEGLIIRWGLAKDSAGAQKILFIILIAIIAATVVIDWP